MLEEVEWGEFKIGDLFEVTGTKSLDSNAIDFVKNGINFIGRTFENNGIQGKIEERDFKPNAPFTITATVIGNYKYVKYQKEPYYCSQNINKLTPNFQINERLAIFFISLIQKFVSQYNGQQGGYKLNEIKNYKIKLPICKDRTINFSFMEKFIAELEASHLAELEASHLAELEAYLTVSNLKNYNLTQAEEKVLKEFENGKIEWGEFEIDYFFDVCSYKKRFDANKVHISEKGKPYITRTAFNNGVRGYIDEEEKYLNEGNTISFGQDTATMFYQEKPYFTGDKIKVLKPKDKNFRKKNALFFINSMSKSFKSFSWGGSSFNENIIKKQVCNIPIKNNKVNYEIMEIFISAIQKLVIKDVVLYSDRKLKAMKEVVEK